jgi:hypothetical protein
MRALVVGSLDTSKASGSFPLNRYLKTVLIRGETTLADQEQHMTLCPPEFAMSAVQFRQLDGRPMGVDEIHCTRPKFLRRNSVSTTRTLRRPIGGGGARGTRVGGLIRCQGANGNAFLGTEGQVASGDAAVKGMVFQKWDSVSEITFLCEEWH